MDIQMEPNALLTTNLELCSQNESFAVVNDGMGSSWLRCMVCILPQ